MQGDAARTVISPRRSVCMRRRMTLGDMLRPRRNCSLVRAASVVMSPPATTPARISAVPVA